MICYHVGVARATTLIIIGTIVLGVSLFGSIALYGARLLVAIDTGWCGSPSAPTFTAGMIGSIAEFPFFPFMAVAVVGLSLWIVGIAFAVVARFRNPPGGFEVVPP